MKGMSVALLCLLGVAMVMTQGEEGEGPPPFTLRYLLEEFLDDRAGSMVETFIAGQCRKVFQESDIQPPPPPPTEEPEKRKLSTLLEKYLHRQKRALEGEERAAVHFCMFFMFGHPEEM